MNSASNDCCVERILMCPADLLQECAVMEDPLLRRIVVEHIHSSRMIRQTLLQVRQHSPQTRLREGIEQIEHDWIGREVKAGCVGTDRLQRRALLRFAVVPGDVFLRDLVQRRNKLYSLDTAKRVIRCQQQRSPFGGAAKGYRSWAADAPSAAVAAGSCALCAR